MNVQDAIIAAIESDQPWAAALVRALAAAEAEVEAQRKAAARWEKRARDRGWKHGVFAKEHDKRAPFGQQQEGQG